MLKIDQQKTPYVFSKLVFPSTTVACKEFLVGDFSIVVLLVPGNAILEQNYKCLQDNSHPDYRIKGTHK